MPDDDRVREAPDAEMQVVHTANGEMEAQALKSVLEAAGIPAELDIEAAAKLFVVTVDGLGAVKIKVPADRVEEARAVLATPAEPIGEEE
jgi:ribosomal protein L12E/L44/L45/RPP1/RPP2